ncbi:MAG: response regulator [Candidatus Peribacteraceae bacterium]|nr:response regulator [Candidatus Peribacteraceae bacterium]MDD5739577.1 response regulator [Candidatus Peribacteraceae bacterium]
MPPTLAIIKDNGAATEVARIAREAGVAPEDIFVARTKADALALIQKLIPDFAVVDPHLTEDERLEDGIEIIKTLRGLSRQCIIICLTMQGTPELGIRALLVGANDHIDVSWAYINWHELLRQKLDLWKGVIASRHTRQ